MNTTPTVKQLVHSIEKLVASNTTLIEVNQQLSEANHKNTEIIKKLSKRQEKILSCFSQIYKFTNSKNEKTWIEHNYMKELFELITNANSFPSSK